MGVSLTAWAWVVLVVAALLVGFAKTAVGGAGAVAAALFAAVLPARASTGAVLPLLICGDVMAVAVYRRHADWGVLVRLFPWVAVGTVLGAVFMAHNSDAVMRRAIGILLLTVVALHVLIRSKPVRKRLAGGAGPRAGDRDVGSDGVGGSDGAGRTDAQPARHRVWAAVAGIAAGFATMVANAAGAVTTIYLMLSGFGMLEFLGTTAWFYMIVNVFKVPFSVSLGLIAPGSLALDAALLPAVLLGGFVGVRSIRRIKPEQFEAAVLGLAAVSAALLLR